MSVFRKKKVSDLSIKQNIFFLREMRTYSLFVCIQLKYGTLSLNFNIPILLQLLL